MSDRVLVTGAGGYLGRQVVEALRTSGIETIGVVRREASCTCPGRTAVCELADAAAVGKLISENTPSAVVHAAAWIGSGAATADTFDLAVSSNVVATANLAAACAKAGVGRLIHCSSVEVYGPEPFDGAAYKEDDALAPQGLYGRTKAAGEFVVRALDGTLTTPLVLRMPGLHGALREAGIVQRLLKSATARTPVELPEPHTRLSFLWVTDAARVLAAASLGKLAAGPVVLNVANGDTTLLELAKRVGELAGSPLEIRVGSTPARNRALDLARMRAALPFALPPFEDGLRFEFVPAQAG